MTRKNLKKGFSGLMAIIMLFSVLVSPGKIFAESEEQIIEAQLQSTEETSEYTEFHWSFEDGTMAPFTTTGSFKMPNICDADYCWNNTGYSMNKDGTYYMSTIGKKGAYDEVPTGEFVSTAFVLDPSNPTVSFRIAGGHNSANYVAICNAETEEILARQTPPYQTIGTYHPLVQCSLTLSNYTENTPLVIKVVDGTTANWGFVHVDDFRFVGKEYVEPEDTVVILDTIEKVMEATGWNEEDFQVLISMIEDHMASFSDEEYPEGAELLEAIESMQDKQIVMAEEAVAEDSEDITKWIADMEELANEVYVTNPLLGSGLMIFTVHHQYNTSHHNTHNMFPSYKGEIDNQSLFTPGGAVKVMNLRTGEVTTLLEDKDGVYRDLDVSYDANKILLSYRDNRLSTYNIVEYTLSKDMLSVTGTKQLTSLPTADDMDPMYMPSGNIVFSSTRDPKYVMCNRHIAANIYRMEPDGANIVKITSSTLFERPTDVLPDGRILYDRWEYNDRDFASAQGIWTVYEDGTKQDTYYGNNSPTGAAIEAKVIPGTNKIMAVLGSTHDLSWGALAVIDRSKGVDGSKPIDYARTWPRNYVTSQNVANPGGYKSVDAYVNLPIKYEDPQPLSEDYFLASRMIDSVSKKMGIYLLDTYGNEILLYEDDSAMGAFDATILQPRQKELQTSSRRNYNDDVGTFFVQDVYEGTHMAGVERGTVKSLRIVESMDKKYIAQVNQWDGEGQQNPGVNWHSFEVKRVIGEVPVYEDGSAYFEVPQDVFVYFQLLDEDGRMIQSMRSGTLVQSGEQTGCVGCHEDRRSVPKTNTGYETPLALKANISVIENPDYVEGSNLPKTIAVNTPDVPQKRVIDFETKKDKLVDWNDEDEFPEYTDLPSMNFLTEVQPIFTNNCLECHGYDRKEANLTLVPDKDVIFNTSYINLWMNRGKTGVLFENLVGAVGAGDTTFYNAKQWGSYNSPLIDIIYNDENHKNLLTDAEKRRVAEWVDLNATYYGDYTTNYGFNAGSRSPLTAAERTALGDNRGMTWGGMRSTDNLSKAIYFDNPEKSPILEGKTGDDYDKALAIIQAGLERLRINPDVDWRGLTIVPGNTALKINPYKMNNMDAWRTEKVKLYDAMEAANRAAIVNGEKLYDSDHEETMSAHNAKWPGWPSSSNTGNAYTELPE